MIIYGEIFKIYQKLPPLIPRNQIGCVGASRIVLYHIDWNSATDLQAMARVWRDGQTRLAQYAPSGIKNLKVTLLF